MARLPDLRMLFGRPRAASRAERDIAAGRGASRRHASPPAGDAAAGSGESDSDITASIEPYSPPAIHTSLTTPEDIFYCFRLLLNRCPNPEEWPGHSSRVGESLENVVASFVTSREFAQRGLLSKADRYEAELVRLPEFSLFASREDLAVGKHIVGAHSYEPSVAAVLRRYVRPGMAVVDIGANIGYLTMMLASLVGASGLVVAVEPNPENVKLLEASRRANGFDHVMVVQAAAGRGIALLALNVSYSNGTTGELPDGADAIIASSLVPCFALDAILPDIPIDLIKIDIEGAELNALIGLARTIDRDRPVIISEFSPGALPGISDCSGPDYLRYLIARGYRIGVIEKDGSERMFGSDIGGVMRVYTDRGVDHIDISAIPS